MPPKFSAEILEKIRERANYLCEYCRTDERWQLVPFNVDHIVPLSSGGTNDLENLALACFHCNRRKSDKQFVFDPTTLGDVPLYDPRSMKWSDHFRWSDNFTKIESVTDIGRVTIKSLDLNRPRIIQLRIADILVKRHPPDEDLETY